MTQEQIDVAFKLQFEKLLSKDLNVLYNQIINFAVNYYENNNSSTSLQQFTPYFTSIFFLNWNKVRNKFLNITNNLLLNTQTYQQLNDIIDNGFYQNNINKLLYDIKQNSITQNTITMNNFVRENTGSVQKTNEKQFYEASILGLSTLEFRNKIKDYYKNRISTISTTFTQQASETSKSSYFNQVNNVLGYVGVVVLLTKTWRATLDEKTREAHADADGQTVGINEYYNVDGEFLKYPADTRTASLSNTINCRCSSIINF